MFFISLQKKKNGREWEGKIIPYEWWFFLGILGNALLFVVLWSPFIPMTFCYHTSSCVFIFPSIRWNLDCMEASSDVCFPLWNRNRNQNFVEVPKSRFQYVSKNTFLNTHWKLTLPFMNHTSILKPQCHE